MRPKKAKKLMNQYNTEWKDHHIHLHCNRVMNHVSKVCELLKIDEDYKNIIEQAAKYHDIGKINYRPWMLMPNPFKNRQVTKKSIGLFKKHVKDGYNILKSLPGKESIASFVLYHHEKMDGSGFLKGLKDKDISLGVKILTVCDTYDAMTKHYNQKTKEEAIKELKYQRGKQLDKKIVDAFLKILDD